MRLTIDKMIQKSRFFAEIRKFCKFLKFLKFNESVVDVDESETKRRFPIKWGMTKPGFAQDDDA